VPRRLVKLVRENQTVSLRLRLTLWIVVLFTFILWSACGVFWLYQNASINQMFNTTLAERAHVYATSVGGRMPGLTRDALDERVRGAVPSVRYESFVIDVFDADGAHVVEGADPVVDAASLPIDDAFESAAPVPVPNPVWAAGMQDLAASGMRAVVVGIQADDSLPYVVFVATTDRFAREQLALVSRVLVTIALGTPLAALVSGWFIAGIAVAPFHRLQDVIRQMRPHALDKSIRMEASSSEVVELAAELDDLRVRLKEAFAAQERFLSNVSHEIKTPIAVMQMESQTLDLEKQSEEVAYFVSSVREEMGRLGNLVESFLTLTRIEDGQGKVRGKPMAANDLAMDSVEHCAVMANQNRVWLRPKLFADEATIDTTIAGDHELLKTMLDNLIRNAIRFTPRESGVQIELSRRDGTVEIAVRDEGPGIPPERLATVFDRFAQVSGPERRGRGHGLGLAIARGIAELHGGTIRASNRPGGGCEFLVVLPVLERDDARRRRERPEGGATSRSGTA
jgi:signal transduction histidine kinase